MLTHWSYVFLTLIQRYGKWESTSSIFIGLLLVGYCISPWWAKCYYLNQCWPRCLMPKGITMPKSVHSVALKRCSGNIHLVIFKLISDIHILSISDEIALGWMPQDPTDRKWQDYVYIQCEYKSTKQKIKHLLREENKVKENKIS